MLKKLKFWLLNKVRVAPNNHLDIDPSARIKSCHIRIYGTENKLIVGPGVALRGVLIEIDGEGCTIELKQGSVIGRGCYLSARERETRLEIGKSCMLSRNVKLMTSDGHDILANNKRINPASSIIISDNVWLADGVVVLKGVTIGDGTVVGIQSVLTQSLESRVIAAGNPAKVIKTDIDYREELTY